MKRLSETLLIVVSVFLVGCFLMVLASPTTLSLYANLVVLALLWVDFWFMRRRAIHEEAHAAFMSRIFPDPAPMDDRCPEISEAFGRVNQCIHRAGHDPDEVPHIYQLVLSEDEL